MSTSSPGAGPSLAAGGGTLLFTDTSEAGLYRVSVFGPGAAQQDSYIAVNAPGTAIAPQQQLDVTGAKGNALASAPLYQDLWTVLAVAALAVLALEWLVYHRAR